jgi:hypothetical protein
LNNNLKANATRVNPHAISVQSFVRTTGEKEQSKYRTGFVPSSKDQNAALPNTMSWKNADTYVPPNNDPVRSGANDFLAVKSKGYRT